VLKEGETLDLESLRSFCRESIGSYKLPKSLEIRETLLPRSPAGKVLKRELRKPYWAGHERRI
jgi:long-chain acyl-CoA synthetase